MPKQKIKFFKDFTFVLSKTYRFLKKFRNKFLLGIFFIFVIELLNLFSNYIFKDIIDFFATFSAEKSIYLLFKSLIVISFVYVLINLFEYINDTIIVRTEIKLTNYIYLQVQRKLLDLSLAYHEKENTGSKLSKINHGIDSITYLFDQMYWGVFPALIRIVSSFIFLIFIDWRMGLIFLTIIPLFLYLTLKMNIRVNPLRQNIRKGTERVYGSLAQSIYNIQTVKAFVQEENQKKKSAEGLNWVLKKQFKSFKIFFFNNFIRANLITLGSVLIIMAGAYYTYSGQITPGELVLFITVSANSYYSMFQLTRTFDKVMDAKVGLERMYTILENENIILNEDTLPVKNIQGNIEFKNVNFNYGEGNVLKNVNMKIKAGETVALVGPSGGGKSTIAKLIYRYYDVNKGKLLIDGQDVRKLNIYEYRKYLGIVNQDIDIFDDTVRNNIAFGEPKVLKNKVIKAAQIANADVFINKLKNKYNTVVGEKGIKLSGGQKQRIGIARAVLIEPKILILDEATSSLDAESEKMIQQAINRVIKNRTTIIIAHRLSTVKNADKIFVIDNGRIVEQGKHEHLIKQKGTYSKLVKLQVGGYLK